MLYNACPGGFQPSLGPSPASIASLPNEILCEIFHIASSDSLHIEDTSSTFHIGTALSHVMSLWRDIAIGLPSLWTDVRISRIYEVGVLENILNRSKGRQLDIQINLPHAATSGAVLPLWNLLGAVLLQMKRCRNLSIATVKSNYSLIYKIFLPPCVAPFLQSLRLVQVGVARPSVFPPIRFNTNLLSHVHLDGVIWANPSNRLSGLKHLTLRDTEGPWVDHGLEARLESLTLSRSHVPWGFNLGLETSSLKYLKLDGDCSMSFQNPGFTAPALKIFEVSRVLNRVWEDLVFFLQSAPNLFPAVECLKISELDTTSVTIDRRFAEAFPALIRLEVTSADFEPLARVLRGYPAVWPSLRSIVVDGIVVGRP